MTNVHGATVSGASETTPGADVAVTGARIAGTAARPAGALAAVRGARIAGAAGVLPTEGAAVRGARMAAVAVVSPAVYGVTPPPPPRPDSPPGMAVSDAEAEHVVGLAHAGGIQVSEADARIIVGLAHRGGIEVSQLDARIIVGLAHAGGIQLAQADARIIVGLAHRGGIELSEASAQLIVRVSPVAYGEPAIEVPAAASGQFDNVRDDRRDYAAYRAALAEHKRRQRVQSIADKVAARAFECEQTMTALAAMPYNDAALVQPDSAPVEPVRIPGRLGPATFRMNPQSGADTLPSGTLCEFRVPQGMYVDPSEDRDPVQLRIGAEGTEVRVVKSSGALLVQREFRDAVELGRIQFVGVYLPFDGHVQLLSDFYFPTQTPPFLAGPTLGNMAQYGETAARVGYSESSGCYQLADADSTLRQTDVAPALEPGDFVRVLFRRTRRVFGFVVERGGYDPDLSPRLRMRTEARSPTSGERIFGPDLYYTLTDHASTVSSARYRRNDRAVYRVVEKAREGYDGRLELIGSESRYAGFVPPAPGQTVLPPYYLRRLRRVRLRSAPVHPVRAGDVAVLSDGCDKRYDTCRTQHRNAVNFGGQPFLPGDDALAQVVNIRRTVVR